MKQTLRSLPLLLETTVPILSGILTFFLAFNLYPYTVMQIYMAPDLYQLLSAFMIMDSLLQIQILVVIFLVLKTSDSHFISQIRGTKVLGMTYHYCRYAVAVNTLTFFLGWLFLFGYVRSSFSYGVIAVLLGLMVHNVAATWRSVGLFRVIMTVKTKPKLGA